MSVGFTAEQMDELRIALKTHPVPYLRTKALALLNMGKGMLAADVAELLEVDRHTVSRWLRAYSAKGLEGLVVRPGRGRKSRVDEEEVMACFRQSPRNFGLLQERWTLEAFRSTVPSLQSLSSLSSVMYVLHRLGLSVKRGQPAMASPDPEYVKKNNKPKIALKKRG